MLYKVIGLMSGSSLDGLDIAYVHLEEIGGAWSFSIEAAECLPYEAGWSERLRTAAGLTVAEFLKLHTSYGRYLGEAVAAFIARHGLEHRVDFISSHGHTVYHNPAEQATGQIGCGAAIAAVSGLPVISDLRAVDVALGGQGAPIVPIGDRLLFGDYPFLLNLGGIANISLRGDYGRLVAFDVCPANRVLNALASRAGKVYDGGGQIAAGGEVLLDVLIRLNAGAYYREPAPKSLSNEAADALAFPPLFTTEAALPDLMRTAVEHIAEQVAGALHDYSEGQGGKMLVTGGGAFNDFLVERIRHEARQAGVEVEVPAAEVVEFKEALVMALIGALRWREEVNVLASVTGASADSVGGALWKPVA